MSTAEHIYNEVRTLPESQAREVFDFVARLKATRHADSEAQRKAALGTLAKYRGRLVAVNTQRDELNDRGGLADANTPSTRPSTRKGLRRRSARRRFSSPPRPSALRSRPRLRIERADGPGQHQPDE